MNLKFRKSVVAAATAVSVAATGVAVAPAAHAEDSEKSLTAKLKDWVSIISAIASLMSALITMANLANSLAKSLAPRTTA